MLTILSLLQAMLQSLSFQHVMLIATAGNAEAGGRPLRCTACASPASGFLCEQMFRVLLRMHDAWLSLPPQMMLKRAEARESAAFALHSMCDASEVAAAAAVQNPGIAQGRLAACKMLVASHHNCNISAHAARQSWRLAGCWVS